MSNPFLGELRTFSFSYAPKGWAQANGQILQITQNQALFAVLGTQFGGNGSQTFALPNLQGRVPIGTGNNGGTNYVVGNNGGSALVSLTAAQVPVHTHNASGSTGTPTIGSPAANSLPATYTKAAYATSADTTLAGGTVGNGGLGQGHENRQPYLVLNLCIALQGIYPSRS